MSKRINLILVLVAIASVWYSVVVEHSGVCVVPANYHVITRVDHNGNKYMVPGPCAPHINK